MDVRHKRRMELVQNLFASTFQEKGSNLPHKDKVTEIILNSLKPIDEQIAKHATKFPLDRIAKIDLAILRLAIYELIIEKKEPHKVIINEAIELAKELGGDKSYVFVNGVLAKLINKE